MATEITVRGSFTASRPPQRATVHATLSYQGPSMKPVYDRLAEDLDVVQKSVSALALGDDAPVTRWSSDRLRTWSHRPWSQDGEQLPLVYHASASLQVRFRDFAALSSWVGDHVTSIEGFEVDTINWSLTAKANAKMARRVRRQAVRDAVDRAQLYADAVGLGAVTAIAIADVGMLSAGGASDGQRDALFVGAPDGAPGGSGPDVELMPKPIRMSASVDARFVVQERASTESPREIVKEASSAPDEEGDAGAGSAVVEFRDDDTGYRAWLRAHSEGFVVNILRSYHAGDARVHHSSCWTINGEEAASKLTNRYVKMCAEAIEELDRWAAAQVGTTIRRCGTCRPPGLQDVSVSREPEPPSTGQVPVRHDVRGPEPDGIVEALADEYIRFERLPEWQRELRDQIRVRCEQLQPAAEQVLHATFYGPKHPKADVENVLLYYIGTFKTAGRHGIRFEHGITPDNARHGFGYRYALADRTATFDSWIPARTLASFE
ncbi:SIMPL domain-containing protein [Mycobacterium sp. C3-094]